MVCVFLCEFDRSFLALNFCFDFSVFSTHKRSHIFACMRNKINLFRSECLRCFFLFICGTQLLSCDVCKFYDGFDFDCMFRRGKKVSRFLLQSTKFMTQFKLFFTSFCQNILLMWEKCIRSSVRVCVCYFSLSLFRSHIMSFERTFCTWYPCKKFV